MIGERIKPYVVANGIKQSFLAEKAGVDSPTMSDILNGKREVKALELYHISKALKVPMEYFVEQEIGKGVGA